jgi:CRISPR-associated protein Cas5t
MLQLHVKAPFATFRKMSAGYYRPSYPFITPATAYGLILNLAGLESRKVDDRSVMTLTQEDLPSFELALGTTNLPERQMVFQQLHNYPVGGTGIERQTECKGNKYNIQPIRREFLSNLDAWLFIRGDQNLLNLIRKGLSEGVAGDQENGQPRYGIPFWGDNLFMIDILREECLGKAIRWLYPVDIQSMEPFDLPTLYCMPVWMERIDTANTKTALYALTKEFTLAPPDDAWTRVGPPILSEAM